MKEEDYCKTYNQSLKSSLKYMNFQGWSKDEIIEKYESIILQREKQIREIVIQSCSLKSKLEEVNEKVQEINKDNEDLNSLLFKKDSQLKQLLTNKDIMFIKINNMVNENDKLRKVLRRNLAEEEKKDKEKRGRSVQARAGERGRDINYSLSLALKGESNNKEDVKEEQGNGVKKNSDMSESSHKEIQRVHKKRPKKLLSEAIHYQPVFK